ncbi:cation-translocating P-type ATPase [Adhaeribacter sp. BT258]|uniref:Cation-translocating P-type ATPase n=1 Tax=Adhaeribacter terrigena TaxID=2793070 RepID=A0ABS1C5J9_9BACT|nr:cation-translocating P-type ATPase [Adhaeribacter terrigena]MBK0404640.1 cation-translocating P-type ATPase [Adhaeribacter terrigena]
MELIETDLSAYSAEETAQKLQANLKTGLTDPEAAARLEKFGFNEISETEKRSLWRLIGDQLNSPIVYLLLVAAGISFFFQEYLNAMAILIVIVINTAVGFIMEFQAGRSMDALKKIASVPAKILRNSQLQELEASRIVPGDVVFLEAGDVVPADGRIFRTSQLQVEEAALTGESVPVEKNEAALQTGLPLGDRLNYLFKGTFVTRGNTYLLVSHTGMQTQLGHIANLVQNAEQSATPLEKKLAEFSKKLIVVTIGLAIVILVSGLINGQPLAHMLQTVIALAVAAIPEGLPIVATLALGRGMLQMARHNVIVKKLSAVETLGGTNVICTDKTGTLTQNKIEVTLLATPSGTWEISENAQIAENENFNFIKYASVLTNTAEITEKGADAQEIGDPLEVALLKFARNYGTNIVVARQQHPKLAEEPFSSETKMMATLHGQVPELMVFAKGAAEELLNQCTGLLEHGEVKTLSPELKKVWLEQSEVLAGSGLRVLAVAYKTVPEMPKKLSENLIFAGLIGMVDPPRPEVLPAIKECLSAGIRVIMITGDHPATANKIALELGINTPDGHPPVTGNELKPASEISPENRHYLAGANVFARVNPQHKLDLVQLLQEDGNVVAMTGDGVNDAPALKKADIGVAMGLRGTQVAQDVSDMVLKDDKFTSIVVAIRQGRVIFENIRKFVIFLLSCNLSELFLIATVAVLNLGFQLLPLQILFINLITDVLPALALGATEGNPGIMNQPPRKAAEPIIDRQRWIAIIFYSAIISLCALGAVYLNHYVLHPNEDWHAGRYNNILFYSLIFCQLTHVFNMGAGNRFFFRSEIVSNKFVWLALFFSSLIVFVSSLVGPVRAALGMQEMLVTDWLAVVAAVLTSLFIIQISKKFKLIQQ